MIELDYSYSSVGVKCLKKYESKINKIVDNFKNKNAEGREFFGWYEYPKNISEDLLDKINAAASHIKAISEVFVICGIGGSYLGARAVIEALKGFYNSNVEIVYLGNTFDERYIEDTIEYLKDKEFSVNVISKSGSTLETAVAFRFLKKILNDKYGDGSKERIYVTTDAKNGCLREACDKEGYCSFVIPEDIGGRYSVFTPVGLLPLAVAGVDISKFIQGAKNSYENFQQTALEKNCAYQYAAYRYHQYIKNKKKVEVFAAYSPYLNMVSEWWKQLFGESEGKEGKGLFPASVNFSTDLHSLGQFIQQGSRILYISQLMIKKEGKLKFAPEKDDEDGLNYLSDTSIGEINLAAQEGTNKAHFEIGRVDNLRIAVETISEDTLGYLLYFYMCSCMISAYLLKVNPFNQPGVEFYKREMKKMLKKI